VRVALDATYSVDPYPSGVAVYSRELLSGLAATYPEDEFLHCYRLKQFRKAPRSSAPNVRQRLLLPVNLFQASVFHALNQRVDRRPAKRVVATFHDLFAMTGGYSSESFRALFTQRAIQAARNSDLIIAVSAFTANQVASLLRFDPARIQVIPHGVRLPSEIPTAREEMILCVGALQVRKNTIRLVEAFETLSCGWRLVLAGAQHGYGASLILDRIAASPARSRITLTGYVSPVELEQLYNRASIFAFPSLDEGFGIPVLEAMAHGVPVITSNRSALPEVAGGAAWLVNPFDVEEIRAALERFIGDPELREQLAQRGRTRAAQFTWERAVRTTYETYERLLG
jgi:glycosyltransferase involved in cell wall biosynthesis